MSRIKVRASSLASLFDCPRRFEGTNLLGMRSVSGLRATLGTAVHAGTALFDKSRMDGSDMSALDAAGAFIDALHHPEDEVDFRDEDMTIKQAESIGLTLHSKYCNQVGPNYEFVAVELTMSPLVIDMGDGLEIELTGSTDRAQLIDGAVGICDIKTGRASVTTDAAGRLVAKTAGHAAQIAIYELLYEHTTGEACSAPAEIIGMSTGPKQDIAIGRIENAREVLLGTDERPGLLQFAAAIIRSGVYAPNAKSQLCGPKYCPRHAVCGFAGK